MDYDRQSKKKFAGETLKYVKVISIRVVAKWMFTSTANRSQNNFCNNAINNSVKLYQEI